MNKISGMRFREEVNRGHDIISNDQLKGNYIDYKREMATNNARAYGAWNTTIVSPVEQELASVPASNASKRSGAAAAGP